MTNELALTLDVPPGSDVKLAAHGQIWITFPEGAPLCLAGHPEDLERFAEAILTGAGALRFEEAMRNERAPES